MRIRSFLAVLGLVGILLLGGCGTKPLGGSAGGGGGVPFTLAVTDQPPSGVTVLSFTVTVTGAVLQPNNVSILNTPVTIEVTQLQTDTDLLANATIPAGNYTDLILTFANPSVTILNQALPLGACTVGEICQIAESISPTTVDFNTSPLPLTATSGTPVGMLVDFSLNNLLQPDMSLNLAAPGGFVLSQFQTVTTSTVLGTATDIAGVVTAVGSNQLTFTTLEGISVTASTSSATQFFFPSATCSANNFTCITTGEIVAADLNLMGDGTIQAATVAFEDTSGESEISGTIVSINSATNPPTFGIVIRGSAPTEANVTVGEQATVTIESGAAFVIDEELVGLTSGFSFASVADLVVGQEVLVRVDSLTTSTSPVGISSSQIVLRPSEWTADVNLINLTNANFTIGALPSLFTAAQPTNIQALTVDTTGSTVFLDLTPASVAGLAAQNPVSVKGPLFNTVASIGSPSVVATTVVGRNANELPSAPHAAAGTGTGRTRR